MSKIKLHLFGLFLLTLFVTGCSKEDELENDTNFVVAFEKQSLSFSSEESSREINVVFSSPAPQSGSLELMFDTKELVYGTDFTTIPPAENGTIALPVEAGAAQTSFTFNKLTPNPVEDGPEKSVTFTFGEIEFPNGVAQGNKSLLVSYAETASLGGSFAPNVGGPNEPNQVYVDLSAQNGTVVSRDTWDLGFYSGDEFRVKLNSSLFMMAAELETTDIDAVTKADVKDLQSKMAFLVAGSNEFVDAPSGKLDETIIDEISETASENKVYLVHMGDEIGTEAPATGSVAISGEERGWMKIRVLRDGNGYVLQYADLDATTHEEISISKKEAYNFTFFSLNSENIVEVAPQKMKWDLNFSTATEVLALPSGGETAYGFSDYVKTNVLAEVKTYQVLTSEIAYKDFSAENVQPDNFELDQRTIGANWRSVFEQAAKSDRFYIVKDTEGNIYKMKFTALVNENGVRGYPKFEYELVK